MCGLQRSGLQRIVPAMGFRFSRRIKLFPGVRLNVSKSGVSTSVGTKGAWMTFGPRGTRTTVGIPGTGISYTQTHASPHPHAVPTSLPELDVAQLQFPPVVSAAEPESSGVPAWLVLAIIAAVAIGIAFLL